MKYWKFVCMFSHVHKSLFGCTLWMLYSAHAKITKVYAIANCACNPLYITLMFMNAHNLHFTLNIFPPFLFIFTKCYIVLFANFNSLYWSAYTACYFFFTNNSKSRVNSLEPYENHQLMVRKYRCFVIRN